MSEITLSLSQLLLGAGIVAFLTAAFAGTILWLLSLMIRARLENSVRHKYDKLLVDYQNSQLQRQKAEVMAPLLAKWGKYRGVESSVLNDDELYDYYEELNKMSYQATLWIKDAKLLEEVMKAFTQSNDVRHLLSEIRKDILKEGKESFDTKKVVIWPGDPTLASRLFDKDKKSP